MMTGTIIGLAMGFAMRIVFSAVELAGEIAGLEMGLGFATLFSPSSDGSTLVVGKFLGLLATVISAQFFSGVDETTGFIFALAAFAGLIFLHEVLTPPQWLAVVLVIAGGGVAAYGLGYLDRWVCEDGTCEARQPERAAIPDTPAAPVLRPVLAAAPDPGLDTAAVQKAVGPLLGRKALGSHVGFAVSDLSTGQPVWSSGTGAFVPASTLKLFTALAAVTSIGAEHRFRTTVLRDTTGAGSGGSVTPGTDAPPETDAPSAAPARIVLVGGGDPYLAATSGPEGRGSYPQQASLAQLARRTAAALKAEGVTEVSLGYDASLFTGPAVSPAWEPTYITSFVTTPVSALWVDQGRDGWRRSANPDRQAAQVFARQLKARGIAVSTVAKAARRRAARSAFWSMTWMPKRTGCAVSA